MPLSSYILPLASSAALMTVTFLLGKWGYSMGWIVMFIGLSFAKSKMWKQREKRLLALRQAHNREKEAIVAQMQDLPAWVQFPDTERVEWINKVVHQMWPYIGEYAKKYIKENIEPMVRANMPSPFKSFRFEKIDMGDLPCRFGGIKVYSDNVGRDRIIIDMDVAYAGDADFEVSVGAFRGGMNSLVFTGKLRAVLTPLMPQPPMVGGVRAFFMENPQMDFNLTGIGEMVELPGLLSAVKSVVMSQMGAICVLPHAITVPLVVDVDLVNLHFPEPDGIIRLHVVEARNLENKDMTFLKKGRSDPYAVLTVGGQVFKTKVVDDNLSPTWNEFYEALVDESDGQQLRIEVYDEDQGKDEELGRLSIALQDVRAKGVVDQKINTPFKPPAQWYPLDACEHGDLHLKIYWMSLSKDPKDLEVDQWEAEWLKANRAMHSALCMVFVDNAKDLPFPKLNLEPSPVLELMIGSDKKKTFPKWKTVNPVWQEKHVFFVSHPETQTLQIQALDEGTKRQLGWTSLALKTLLEEPGLEMRQHTFTLSQGTHHAPLVMTVRLRPLKGERFPDK